FEFITGQLENYSGVGRVVINMSRALAGRADADIKLLDGDAIFIPTKSSTISVFGEVRRESSFVFNNKYSIDDYITMAAGITRLADEDNIYIVRADGFVEMPTGNWFKFGASRVLQEGDTIIVPVDYSYRAALPFWRDVISIVYQGAVAIAAISGL
ncbi:MAG: sugar transporter, partial [Alphaproteobacteria bacterium]|nr:sugar transporter [Alphaproteobacteria bacterium]